MDEETIQITIEKPFGNLFRDRCVLIAAFDSNQRLLLGAKPDFYPPGIVRLLGGGVNNGEQVNDAMFRELAEETGASVPQSKIHILCKFIIQATDSQGKVYRNETYVAYVDGKLKSANPGDDVKQLVAYTRHDLHELINAYERLNRNLWYKGIEGEFSWYDYAQVYAPIHRKVLTVFNQA